MRYLHTMIRVKDLDASMKFFCDLLGLTEVRRVESDKGRFTLVFLAAPEDEDRGRSEKAPLVELTYNWPDENGNSETYGGGRNFGHLAYEVDDISIELLQKGEAKAPAEPWASMGNTGEW